MLPPKHAEIIIAWAHDMWGDCSPMIEDRNGAPWLLVTNPETRQRYALPISKPGYVEVAAIH